MPEIPNVVPGEPVESNWGNDVRDRIVQRFADATARTASLPFPVAGAMSWLDDPGQLDYFDGAAWVNVADTAALDAGLALKVAKAGDTMTGTLAGPLYAGAARLWADGPASGVPTSPAVKVVNLVAPFDGTFLYHMTGDVNFLASTAALEVTIGLSSIPFASLLLIQGTSEWHLPFSVRTLIEVTEGDDIGGWIRSNNSGSGTQGFSNVTLTAQEVVLA